MIKRKEIGNEEPDITPMIDIVFQLIIFFMVVMTISAVYGITIKFPVQAPDEKQEKKEKFLIVHITSDRIGPKLQGDPAFWKHHVYEDGILEINGEQIPLAVSGQDLQQMMASRKQGFEWLKYKLQVLLNEGYKNTNLTIRGDAQTYNDKLISVMNVGKEVGIEGFALSPPRQ